MFTTKYITAQEALQIVESGNRVFIHGSAATPLVLVKALQNRHHELRDVELVSITVMGDLDFDNPAFKNSFFCNSLFVSGPVRNIANSAEGDYVPVFLNEIPRLFKTGILPIDSAIEIDFTGQVCADSIGSYQYSGIGGQMDFIRGASLSEGGKSIIGVCRIKFKPIVFNL